ncbi:MAG: type II toxin-antitoxin system VapC family toxin [Gemmatimonadota bacterium]
MILIDANILMYAAGKPHPHKLPSVRYLERVASGDVDAAIDAETLQEILHRYRAIGRWKDGRQVYDLARQILPTVLPVTAEILDRARQLLDGDARLMARDALHAAVVLEERLEAICSYDRDFDRLAGITRVEP